MYVYIYIYIRTHNDASCHESWVCVCIDILYCLADVIGNKAVQVIYKPSGVASDFLGVQNEWVSAFTWQPGVEAIEGPVTTSGSIDVKSKRAKDRETSTQVGFKLWYYVCVYIHIVIYGFCMCMRVYTYICVYNRYIHIRIGSVNVWGVQSSKHSSGDQDALHCILLIQRHGRQAWHQALKLLRDCSLTQLTFRIPKKRLHSKAFSGVTSFLIRNA